MPNEERQNDLSNLMTRLEKLERQNRQWRLFSSISVLGAFFAIFLTNASAKEESEAEYFDKLEVGTLTVDTIHGKFVRLEGENGDFVALDSGVFGNAGLIVGLEGKGRSVQLYAGVDGTGHLMLKGPEGQHFDVSDGKINRIKN